MLFELRLLLLFTFEWGFLTRYTHPLINNLFWGPTNKIFCIKCVLEWGSEIRTYVDFEWSIIPIFQMFYIEG